MEMDTNTHTHKYAESTSTRTSVALPPQPFPSNHHALRWEATKPRATTTHLCRRWCCRAAANAATLGSSSLQMLRQCPSVDVVRATPAPAAPAVCWNPVITMRTTTCNNSNRSSRRNTRRRRSRSSHGSSSNSSSSSRGPTSGKGSRSVSLTQWLQWRPFPLCL